MTMINHLPPPLTSAENLQLLKFIQAGDDEARAKVIEGNLRLAIHIARKYQNTGLNVEDLFSIASIGLIKAVNTFKLDKDVKFATYASTCMNNEILMFLRRNNKHLQAKSLEDVLSKDFEGNELTLADIVRDESIPDFATIFDDRNNTEDLKFALDKLTPQERDIIETRYFKGLTQREASKALEISQSYVSRLERKIIKKIRKIINKKNGETKEVSPLRKKNNVIPFKPKEESNMAVKGDVSKAIKMLRTTTVDVSVISTTTGCTLSKISELAKTYRPAIVEEQRKFENESPIKLPERKQVKVEIQNQGTYKGMNVRNKAEWKAIDLLETTRMSYREVEAYTGADYPRIAAFGRKARSEKLRNELKREHARAQAGAYKEKQGMKRSHTGDTDRALQLMMKGEYKMAEIAKMTGVPVGSLTRLRKDYEEGRYEWKDPAILQAALEQANPSVLGEAMQKAIAKSRIPEQLRNPKKLPVMNKELPKERDIPTFNGHPITMSEKPVQKEENIVVVQDSDNYFHDKENGIHYVRDAIPAGATIIYKDDEPKEEKVYVDEKKEFYYTRETEEKQMAEISNANQTSKEEVAGKVTRSFSFNFEASGDKVTVQEFLDELEGIKNMVKEGKIQIVTFDLSVEATK